jgi:hypothetical protein
MPELFNALMLDFPDETVFQERLKGALRRANVRPEIIDQILEAEGDFKHLDGYVLNVGIIPGNVLSVAIGKDPMGGYSWRLYLSFHPSDFASEDDREQLKEFAAEARRAQSYNLRFILDYYAKAHPSDHVLKIVKYSVDGHGRTAPLTAQDL